MKIVIHGINYAPELSGIGKYTGEMAQWLSARGHDVTVVCAPPYYPQWSVGPGYFAWAYRKEVLEGVTVYRCPLWIPKRLSGLRRLVHLCSFAISSLPVMLMQIHRKPDVVMVIAPALVCAPAGLILARLCGARAWLHIQDYEVDAAFGLNMLSGQGLKKSVLAVERFLLRQFDRVSTISFRMLELAGRKQVDADKLYFLSNWAEVSFLEPTLAVVEQSMRMRQSLDIPLPAVVCLYSGNMGAKQGLEILAQAALALTFRRDIYFVFCGQGPGKAILQRLCAHVANVRFLDLQPMEQLPALLAMADIHLLPQKADAADLVMPSKLTGMLASGRCVVATAASGTELAQVVQWCGLVVEPENDTAFTQAIVTLADDPQQRQAMGAGGREYALAHIDKHRVLKAFEDALLTVIDHEKN